MNDCGILVGSDLASEWLFPWWWKHYAQHNTYPVAFADFGMSEYGIQWCRERGEVFSVQCECPISRKEDVSSSIATFWEFRYGEAVWSVREAWLKKPYALMNTPFQKTVWLDIDCMVHKSLAPLFQILDTFEIAVVEDTVEQHKIHLSHIPHFNSGVIAYQKDIPFLSQFHTVLLEYEHQLPGDEELLGQALFLHTPKLKKLSNIYNWRYDDAHNPSVVITHYSGGPGKLKIMETLPRAYFSGVGLPKKKVTL